MSASATHTVCNTLTEAAFKPSPSKPNSTNSLSASHSILEASLLSGEVHGPQVSLHARPAWCMLTWSTLTASSGPKP